MSFFSFQISHRRRRPPRKYGGVPITLSVALGALAMSLCVTSALAQAVNKSTPKRMEVDWTLAAKDARTQFQQNAPQLRSALKKNHQDQVTKRLESYAVKNGMRPLANIAELVAPLFPDATTSPVPVLAPVATDKLLREHQTTSSSASTPDQRSVLSSSIESMQLFTGLSGYDAIVTVNSKTLRELGGERASKPQVHIGSTLLSYGGNADGELVAGLQDLYPGLRSILGAEELTLTFRKYGVSYFLNIACLPVPTNPKFIDCEQGGKLLRSILRELRLIGGEPRASLLRSSETIAQAHPTALSPDFKYFPPGSLMPGTSEANRGGSTSRIEHGTNLTFPIKDAPVFANSQVFMHWGECLGQKIPLPPQQGDLHKRYKCRQSAKELLQFEGHSENYDYPWRDNYCEVRGEGHPIECPLKRGHAGQDLRPQACQPAANNSKRCKIDLFEVVAVTDGFAWWKTGLHENHMRLNADDGTNKLYYMYLHMSPASLKAAGMKRGQKIPVKKGQVLGKVGNFWKTTPGGTSTHLHFEIRRGDDIGKPLSPYFTLIRAYERLLGKAGTEISP